MDGSQIFQEHLMVESLNLTRTMRMSIVTIEPLVWLFPSSILEPLFRYDYSR